MNNSYLEEVTRCDRCFLVTTAFTWKPDVGTHAAAEEFIPNVICGLRSQKARVTEAGLLIYHLWHRPLEEPNMIDRYFMIKN